jgi:hypothetical protein
MGRVGRHQRLLASLDVWSVLLRAGNNKFGVGMNQLLFAVPAAPVLYGGSAA